MIFLESSVDRGRVPRVTITNELLLERPCATLCARDTDSLPTSRFSRTVYTSEVRLWSPPFGDVWRCLASIERSVSLGAGSIVAFPARSSKIDSRLKDVSVLGLCVPSRRVVPERRFGLNSGERKTKFFEVFEFEGFEYDDSNFLRKILEEKVCSRIRIRDEFVRIFSLPRNFDSFYKVVCIK